MKEIQKNGSEQFRKRKVLIIALFLLLSFSLGIAFTLLIVQQNSADVPTTMIDQVSSLKLSAARNQVIQYDEDKAENIDISNYLKIIDENTSLVDIPTVEENYFKIKANSVFTYKNGYLYGYIANPAENTLGCGIQLYVDGNLVLSSNLIPPNSYLDELPLKLDLDTPNGHIIKVIYNIVNKDGKIISYIPIEADLINYNS